IGAPVARHLAVAIDEAIIGGLHAAVLIGDVAHARAGDELLPLEYASQEQADDDQDDGHLDQGESPLTGNAAHDAVPAGCKSPLLPAFPVPERKLLFACRFVA